MGNQQSSTGGTPSSPGGRSTPGHVSPPNNDPNGSSTHLPVPGSSSSTSMAVPSSSSSTSRPLAGGVSSLFGGGRDRSSSITSSLGRTKSNSVSFPVSPSTPPGLIDGGHLHPQGLYALRPVAQQDYSGVVVKGLIVEKKLAPFYRGLEDYEEEWGEEEVIAALKEVRASQAVQAEAEAAAAAANGSTGGTAGGVDELGSAIHLPGTSSPSGSNSGGGGGSGSITAGSIKKGLKSAVSGVVAHKSSSSSAAAQKEKEERERESRQVDLGERERKEARAYRAAVECPICFLYYPPNINTSRCCEQPICTECFVQIKRAEATITHLESEPAACPYCMETDFGVIYEVQKIARPETLLATSPSSSDNIGIDPRADGQTPRRKSVSSKSKAVVTIDQIRPDWEDKLNSVKAQAARRASRRIIMHRVGDRLIPVGYTSSRSSVPGTETGPITTEMTQEAFQQFMAAAAGGGRGVRSGSVSSVMAGAGAGGGSGGRRSSRRETREGANDLEEMMIMEAMRLSMLEHEEQQRREAEAKKKARGGDTGSGAGGSFLQPRTAGSGSSSAASSVRNLGSVPAPQTSSPTFPPLGSAYAQQQPGLLSAQHQRPESSPLSGTPITRSEVDLSRPQRPDLINLDSDAAIMPAPPGNR